MKEKATYCRMNPHGVFVNGRQKLSFNEIAVEDALTEMYRNLALEYPKFYKMDLLSKVAFLGVELLKTVDPSLVSTQNDDQIGLLFANSEGSTHTDIRFQESYLVDLLPSPSLFVYTLPNIALGEIAIRNKWHGAHMFAVFPNFVPVYYADHGKIMLEEGAKVVIGGWLDVREKLDALFFVMDEGLVNNRENILHFVSKCYSN